MKKEPFVTKTQLDEIVKEYPTPFHLYDEKGIRENVKALKEAFAWNKGYKEYFAVKATPNPFLINILREYGCGCDCSSYTELMLSDANFLILDEPTRGIDIGTKTEIQKLVLDLADQGMAVTFISSEVEEMLRTCSRMGVLRDGKKVGEISGNELSQEGIMKAIAGGGDNE